MIYTYPRGVMLNALFKAVIALTAPFLVVAGGQFAVFVVGGGWIEGDISRLGVWGCLIVGAAWLLLVSTNVPRGYRVLQNFSVEDGGLVCTILGYRQTVRWENIESVALQKQTGFRPTMVREDIFTLYIRSGVRPFIIYDDLNSFADFVRAVSTQCNAHDVVQFLFEARQGAMDDIRRSNPDHPLVMSRRGIRLRTSNLTVV